MLIIIGIIQASVIPEQIVGNFLFNRVLFAQSNLEVETESSAAKFS